MGGRCPTSVSPNGGGTGLDSPPPRGVDPLGWSGPRLEMGETTGVANEDPKEDPWDVSVPEDERVVSAGVVSEGDRSPTRLAWLRPLPRPFPLVFFPLGMIKTVIICNCDLGLSKVRARVSLFRDLFTVRSAWLPIEGTSRGSLPVDYLILSLSGTPFLSLLDLLDQVYDLWCIVSSYYYF
jgi:hypothetical protein